MKYRFQEVLVYCQKHPRAWTEIHQRGQISPDHQWFETATPIHGLREHIEGRPRGLGDTIARLLKLFVKPKAGCGCSKRIAWLNRLFPYR